MDELLSDPKSDLSIIQDIINKSTYVTKNISKETKKNIRRNIVSASKNSDLSKTVPFKFRPN